MELLLKAPPQLIKGSIILEGSKSEAARRGRISASTVQQVVAGTTRPGVKLCQAIARAFDLPVEEVRFQM